MKVIFKQSFAKDLNRIRDKTLLKRVEEAILHMEEAKSLEELGAIRKMQGSTFYYRLRVGDYRLGVRIEGETIWVVRFLHRKDIYRYFP